MDRSSVRAIAIKHEEHEEGQYSGIGAKNFVPFVSFVVNYINNRLVAA